MLFQNRAPGKKGDVAPAPSCPGDASAVLVAVAAGGFVPAAITISPLAQACSWRVAGAGAGGRARGGLKKPEPGAGVHVHVRTALRPIYGPRKFPRGRRGS